MTRERLPLASPEEGETAGGEKRANRLPIGDKGRPERFHKLVDSDSRSLLTRELDWNDYLANSQRVRRLAMKSENKAIGSLWWSLFWRYFLYSFGFQIIVSFLLGLLHLPSPHDLYSQHRSILVGIDSAWHLIASFVALKQAVQIHRCPIGATGI